jgi:hypothetical protein
MSNADTIVVDDTILDRWLDRLLSIQGAVDHLDEDTVVGPKLHHAKRAQTLVESLRREVKQAQDEVRRAGR